MVKGRIGFRPVISGSRGLAESESNPAGQMQLADEAFRCFWSLDAGWGAFTQGMMAVELKLMAGSLPLHELALDKTAFDKAAGTLPLNHPGSAIPYPGVRALSLDCRSETGVRFVSANIREGVVELEDGFMLLAGETLVIPLV